MLAGSREVIAELIQFIDYPIYAYFLSPLQCVNEDLSFLLEGPVKLSGSKLNMPPKTPVRVGGRCYCCNASHGCLCRMRH